MEGRALYEAVAKAIREVDLDSEDRRSVAVRVGGALADRNPRFSLPRFLDACLGADRKDPDAQDQ